MTTVYLLSHDDRMYDMGDTYVRGVYADRALADLDIETRTPAGRLSRAYDAHTRSCCSVEEWDVNLGRSPDVKADPEPVEQTGGSVVPQAFVDEMFAELTRLAGPWDQPR